MLTRHVHLKEKTTVFSSSGISFYFLLLSPLWFILAYSFIPRPRSRILLCPIGNPPFLYSNSSQRFLSSLAPFRFHDNECYTCRCSLPGDVAEMVKCGRLRSFLERHRFSHFDEAMKVARTPFRSRKVRRLMS